VCVCVCVCVCQQRIKVQLLTVTLSEHQRDEGLPAAAAAAAAVLWRYKNTLLTDGSMIISNAGKKTNPTSEIENVFSSGNWSN